jgi:autotransporter-associated beta strand protein
LTRANVRNGGAIIDTNGANVTVNQPLLHSNVAGDNATDSGLTKNGAGTLRIGGGLSTYTGNTVINGGTLQLPVGVPPAAVGAYSFDLPEGGLSGGAVIANSGSGGAALNGAVNAADDQLDNVNGTASISPGKFGNALNLAGLGTSVDVASRIVDQAGAGSWTLSSWIKTSTTGSSIVSKNGGASTWNTGHAVFYSATTRSRARAASPPAFDSPAASCRVRTAKPSPSRTINGTW